MSVISLAEHKGTCCSQKKKSTDTVVLLPIAPKVVARTRFSPPPSAGNKVIIASEILEGLDQIMKTGEVSMVAITGPGDPLATPEITVDTIKIIKERYPQLKIGLKTIGIDSGRLASSLAQAGVDYIEMQVDGVKTEILEKLYAWIRPGSKTLKISDAADLLIKEQRSGVPALKFHNITVSILTTLYPGYNIDHVAQISSDMMELGADSMSLLPYSPEEDVEVELEHPSAEAVAEAVRKAEKHLPVTKAALVQKSGNARETKCLTGSQLPKPNRERPNIAVASSNGIEVDLHLGQALRFLIYGKREDGLACLLEAREAPGSGNDRWQKVADILQDCSILLVANAGETPRKVLAETGLTILITEENIEGTVDVLYGGGKKGKKQAQKNEPQSIITQ